MSKLNIISIVVFLSLIASVVALDFNIKDKNISSIRDIKLFKMSITKDRIALYNDSRTAEKIMEVKLLNNVKNNVIQDCGLYTCEFKIKYIPKIHTRFNKESFVGKYRYGNASLVDKYAIQNKAYNVHIPIYDNISMTNITKNGSINYTYKRLIGNKTVTKFKDFKMGIDDVDWSKNATIVFVYHRDKPIAVDLYPSIAGTDLTEWAYWVASGGNRYTVLINGTNYTIHEFTSDGVFNVTQDITNATILIVAGGGGAGGRNGAGGGAGGVIYRDNYNISTGNYNIDVGSGGQGDPNGDTTQEAMNGSNSSFNGLIAIGGGAGSQSSIISQSSTGGSGGGGEGYSSPENQVTTGKAGTSGQGYAGSNGYSGGGYCGGGGGGANGTGADATTSCVVGTGGVGFNSSINGSYYVYGTGGDGGKYSPASGNGADGTNYGDGGTGGGGASGSGGDGGTGIVIIRYETVGDAITTTLNSPTDNENYITGTSSIIFKWNCSGDRLSYYANLTIDGVDNATGITSSNNTEVSQSASFSENKSFNWSVTCYNSTTSTTSSVREFRIWYPPPSLDWNLQTEIPFTNSTQYDYTYTSWLYNTLGDSQKLNMTLQYSNGTSIASNNSVNISDDGIGIVYGNDSLILESSKKNVTVELSYVNATNGYSVGSQSITFVKPNTAGLVNCITQIGSGCGVSIDNDCAVIIK